MSQMRPLQKVYIAAAFRSKSVRKDPEHAYGELVAEEYISLLESIEAIFLDCGYETCLPHRDEGQWGGTYYHPAAISALCLRHVATSDVVFAIAEGGRGVHLELGYAAALGKRLIIAHQASTEPSTLVFGLPDVENEWGLGRSASDSVFLQYDDQEDLFQQLRAIRGREHGGVAELPFRRRDVCVIDVGSHTLKLRLYASSGRGPARVVLGESSSLGIMDDVVRHGRFEERTIAAIAEAVASWRALAMNRGVQEMYLTGSAAVRKARNADVLVARLAQEAGLEMLILDREAELGLVYEGVRAAFSGSERLAVLNVGGGSTQIAIETHESRSDVFLELGTRQVMERWPWNRPLSAVEYEQLRGGVLEAMRPSMGSAGRCRYMVHTGGELDFLLKCRVPMQLSHLSPSHVSELRTADFGVFCRQFAALGPDDAARMFHLDRRWAAGSVAANAIALAAAELVGATAIIPSNRNIADGIIQGHRRQPV